MATSGVLSLILTWWSIPIDQVGGFLLAGGQLGRFSPLLFGVRNIAPLGYAAFAFVLSVAIGMLVRRTLPAMAITLACIALVMVAWPNLIRPHLTTGVMSHNGEITMPVTNLPGAWIISNQTIATSGQVFVLPPTVKACATGSAQQCNAWLATQHLQRHIAYRPASRYWAFQWYETAIFLALALAVACFCFFWIRHRRPS
jgi:hypothetical protein